MYQIVFEGFPSKFSYKNQQKLSANTCLCLNASLTKYMFIKMLNPI